MDRAGYNAVGGRTRFVSGLLAISVLAALVVLVGEHAAAKRVVGTSGADRITGTAKADRVNARGGNDRINGRRGGDRLKGARGKDRIKGAKGKDRLLAGKGRDRLKAVDDKRDRAVNGGAGKDVCTIDQADLPALKSCEKAKVRNGPGGGPGGGLRVTSATGLTCGSSLPTCQFEINGQNADATTGTVSGGGGVGTAAGAAVSTTVTPGRPTGPTAARRTATCR